MSQLIISATDDQVLRSCQWRGLSLNTHRMHSIRRPVMWLSTSGFRYRDKTERATMIAFV